MRFFFFFNLRKKIIEVGFAVHFGGASCSCGVCE
jgi:hypothetical protein